VELNKAEGEAILAFWHQVDCVFGVLTPQQATLPVEVDSLVKERLSSRKVKNFQRADQIRGELLSAGYQLEDTPEGTLVFWGQGRVLVLIS
jgi:cysteinyl-tRNA synthetase